MNITFGIITSGKNDDMLNTVIDSIVKQNIPHYEIIIVGNTSIITDQFEFIKRIDFDETVRPNWITRKKNIICQNAKYEIIVLIHDYVKFCEDWYSGFVQFGPNFDICVTKIKTIEGSRFRDYTLFPFNLGYPYESRALLSYDCKITPKINKLMYISGTYYVIKKQIALDYPLNELLCWGDAEDVELSKRLTDNSILINCNPYSTVQLLKHKEQCQWEQEMTKEEYVRIESMSDSEIDNMNKISKTLLRNVIKQRTGYDLY
jgi:hypothetical protein